LEWEKAQCKSSQSFGNIVFVHKPKKLKSKLDSKTTQGLFMGYKGNHTGCGSQFKGSYTLIKTFGG